MVTGIIKRRLNGFIEKVVAKVVAIAKAQEENARRNADEARTYISADDIDPLLRKKTDRLAGPDKGVQIFLSLKYQDLLRQHLPLPGFGDVEFRCFSQNGEDGILHYIFSLIGATNKIAVEMCAGNGTECNSANLLINHGWVGLLLDGNEDNINAGKEFYAKCQETFFTPPTLVHAWITAENVNQLIRSNGFEGEIDLLTLDLDGVDYWIWKAIDCIRPRVVVVEYHSGWGPEKSVTVPYRPDFQLDSSDPVVANYFGASLAAFVKLGWEKGYRLVGCQRYGLNAFFLRSDVGKDVFPEVPASRCFEVPLVNVRKSSQQWFVPSLNREWAEV